MQNADVRTCDALCPPALVRAHVRRAPDAAIWHVDHRCSTRRRARPVKPVRLAHPTDAMPCHQGPLHRPLRHQSHESWDSKREPNAATLTRPSCRPASPQSDVPSLGPASAARWPQTGTNSTPKRHPKKTRRAAQLGVDVRGREECRLGVAFGIELAAPSTAAGHSSTDACLVLFWPGPVCRERQGGNGVYTRLLRFA